MTTAQEIFEQVSQLPEPLVREVLDFVAFLKERYERDTGSDLMLAQQDVLRGIWDNEADDVWNGA